MKRLLIWIVVIAALATGVVVGYPKAMAEWKERNRPTFRTEKVRTGDIQWTVEASGTIEPVLKIQIGSFVSGPITEINADFNDVVEEGDLLAKVDPRIYEAAYQSDKAALARVKADVQGVEADLQLSINEEQRARDLLDINEGYISQSEMDQLRYARKALEARLKVAQLQVKQAEANMANSALNLEYTNIQAPEAGVVIDRMIDPGQTLAAQFQAPELFVLAPDMDKRMWVHANVVEADVGNVIKAKSEDRIVKFYVDAYEGELFEGRIHQVRLNPTSEQNVVTYPVIVETTNPGMRLLPGMTANLSFEIEKKKNVLLIPAAALRFLPEASRVRKEDKELVEGKNKKDDEDFEPSAEERVKANRKKKKRHVWVQHDDDKLKAIEVEFGISDGHYYELAKGELTDEMELVVAVEKKKRNEDD